MSVSENISVDADIAEVHQQKCEILAVGRRLM
jgi:hypothetical protein